MSFGLFCCIITSRVAFPIKSESNEVYWWGGVGGKRAIGEAEFSRQHVLWPVSEGRGRVRRSRELPELSGRKGQRV